MDDLDEGSDEVRRYKSISRAPAPMLLQVSHLEDAFAKAVEVVAVALTAGRSICVMVPTKPNQTAHPAAPSSSTNNASNTSH